MLSGQPYHRLHAITVSMFFRTSANQTETRNQPVYELVHIIAVGGQWVLLEPDFKHQVVSE